MWTALLSLPLSLCLISADTPRIQVVDLDDATPHHVIVIIDGEPYKATTLPIGVFPGPTPGPSPAPTPGPAPDPAPPVPDDVKPLTGTLWVTYIVPAVPTEADSMPAASADLHALLKPGSVEWRYQAVGDVEISRRKFDEYAAQAPIAIFQDQTGKVVKTLKGNSPTAIVKLVQAFKGVKP